MRASQVNSTEINNPRVLVIDDESDIRELIHGFLVGEGYQVRTASSGPEAIDLFKSEPFDLAVTDMRMPGMDGLEVSRRLKEMDDDIEIIILTGFGSIKNVLQAVVEIKVFDYLEKPLENVDDLLHSVERALERRRLSIENRILNEKLKQSNFEMTKANEQLKAALEEQKRIGNELEKSRNRLFQAQKMEALGKLVSGVAHEINNPNNFIMFNLPILKEYLLELLHAAAENLKGKRACELFGMTYPEFRRDLFKLMDNLRNGSERINDIVSRLKGFSLRKDDLNTDWVDIGQVIEKAMDICEDKVCASVKSFDAVVSEDLPKVRTDPEILKHVLGNIIINAAQAADKENAWIKINAAAGDAPRDRVIIEVQDNGSGMDRETMNSAAGQGRIF